VSRGVGDLDSDWEEPAFNYGDSGEGRRSLSEMVRKAIIVLNMVQIIMDLFTTSIYPRRSSMRSQNLQWD
jgi:hypothetical protein